MTRREKEIVAAFGLAAALLAGGKLGLARVVDNKRSNSCQSQLRQIALCFAQYAKDHDSRLPRVAVNDVRFSSTPFSAPYGWADGVQPWLKSTTIFQCPSDGFMISQTGDAAHAGFTDYWMNTNLSGHKLSALPRPGATVVLGDGVGGLESDARYSLVAPPGTSAIEGDDGVARSAWHHSGGANFVFGDGHVKWLQPGQLSTKAGEPWTFAVPFFLLSSKIPVFIR